MQGKYLSREWKRMDGYVTPDLSYDCNCFNSRREQEKKV